MSERIDRRTVWVLLALLMGMLGACSAAVPGASANPLAGTQWVLESLRGADPLPGPRLTLGFDEEGQAGGNAGCNSYGGGYVVEGERLRIGGGDQGLAMTMMACAEQARMDQEQRFVEALGAVERYRLDEGNLILLDGAGNELLRFAPQARFDTDPEALRGSSWLLRSLDGEPLLPESAITLLIEEDNQMRGWAGCRRYTASYAAEGDQITIPSMGMVETICPAPEPYLVQEGNYTTLLGSASQVELGGDTLVLHTPGGQTLTFEALPEDSLEPLGPPWQLVAFEAGGEEEPVLPGSAPTLRFGPNQVAGSGSCNQFFGSYYEEGELLIVEGVGSTEMACLEPEGVMEQESRYLAALRGPLQPRVEGETLRLEAEDGSALLFRALLPAGGSTE